MRTMTAIGHAVLASISPAYRQRLDRYTAAENLQVRLACLVGVSHPLHRAVDDLADMPYSADDDPTGQLRALQIAYDYAIRGDEDRLIYYINQRVCSPKTMEALCL